MASVLDEKVASSLEDKQEQNEAIDYTTVDAVVEQHYHAGIKTWTAVVALALANGCATFSNTVNTTIKYQVQTTGNIALAPWIANASFLVTLALGPILGSLSDRVGKKYIIVISCLFGVIGAAIAGSATVTSQIVAGQSLVGIANAGCLVSISATQEIIPNSLRPYAQAVATTINGIAAIVGTYGWAAMVQHNVNGKGGWQDAYFTLLSIYGFVAFAVFTTYWPPKPELARHNSLSSLLKHVDVVGSLLFAGSIASLVIGLTWGGSQYAWSDGHVVATLVCGCVGLVVVGLHQRFIKRDGLFNNLLFQELTFPVLLFVSAIDGMLLLGGNVFSSQEIQAIFTPLALDAAVYLLPYLLTSAFLCLPAGYVLARTRNVKWPLVISLCWTALFTGLLALVTPDTKAIFYVFFGLAGCGLAFTTVLPVVGVSLVVPQNLLGSAATIALTMRALGGIIGITIFTAILDGKLGGYLDTQVAQVVEANGLPPALVPVLSTVLQIPNPAAIESVPNLTPAIIGQLEAGLAVAEAQSFHWVWIAVAIIVAANAVAALFIGSVKDRFTAHVESALEDGETRRKQLAEEI